MSDLQKRAHMKYLLSLNVLLLSLFTITGYAQKPASAKSLTPLDQNLIAAEKNFIAAAKKHDDDYFKRTLTDDYAFVGYDGQLHDRQEVLSDRSSDSMDLMPYNMNVVELTDGAAIVTYDVILQVPPEEDQGPPPRYQHWSSVWTKQGDQWKLKFQQTTPTHWGDW
jgi:hypothetical protein